MVRGFGKTYGLEAVLTGIWVTVFGRVLAINHGLRLPVFPKEKVFSQDTRPRDIAASLKRQEEERWREEALARFNRLRATSRTNGPHEGLLYLRTSQSAPDLSPTEGLSPHLSPHDLSPASQRSLDNVPAAWTLDGRLQQQNSYNSSGSAPAAAPLVGAAPAERVLVSGTRGVVN